MSDYRNNSADPVRRGDTLPVVERSSSALWFVLGAVVLALLLIWMLVGWGGDDEVIPIANPPPVTTPGIADPATPVAPVQTLPGDVPVLPGTTGTPPVGVPMDTPTAPAGGGN